MKRQDIVERFWLKVDRPSDDDACWKWKGSHSRKNGYGYGQLGTCENSHVKIIRAHRLSWEIHNGPIPDGLCVLHKCDNPECSNPNHLFLGTDKDNMEDAANKDRMHSKVSNKEVREIREKFASGMRPLELSLEYSVSRATIYNIVRGLHRKQISGPVCKTTIKLSPEKNASLVAEYATGNFTQRALADRYGVHYSYVSLLVRGKRRTYKAEA